ncbi:hypothetical protein IWQ60_004995 [Tieghemiomyces parasiticus]|uniref:Protein kinase domain-containing protein n=1 Tax=Tieghemiomyces parasiticus TaxID=78921 RepID=A0A9W8DV11_9FUNG|nr:hypothetical protein IWQ60_004995 [Tieghemiomyces parasiticus]
MMQAPQMPMPMMMNDGPPMVPMPGPPMGPPISTANVEAQMHAMMNMNPFDRRRSAFPTPAGPAPAGPTPAHLKRNTTTATSKDASGSSSQNLCIYGYRLTKSLGRGTFSKVYLGVNKLTDEHVALKFIKNRPGNKSDKHEIRVQREINILTLIQHPNIISIKKRADTANNTILVMEYAQGGELLSYIRQKGRLQESDARNFFRQIVSAIDYCHKNCILHRDLKLENVMLDAKRNIKIIDFGFANTFQHEGLLDTFCGSPFYAAPEMVNGVRYTGPEVDIWSMGVILFFMLCGRTPFEGENLREIYQKISLGQYTIPPNSPISNAAAVLIRRMLDINKETRIKMEEIRLNPWVNEGYDGPPNDYFPVRPNHATLQPRSNIIRELVNRHNHSEREVRECLRKYAPGGHPVVCLYYLYEDYIVRRQQQKSQSIQRNPQSAESRPGARDKPGRMSMPVGERTPNSPGVFVKAPGGPDPRNRRSFHPSGAAAPNGPGRHDRRSAYALAEEDARMQADRARKHSSSSSRRESSGPSQQPPTPGVQCGATLAPNGGGPEYFERPKHLSQNMGESPTGHSFMSIFGQSRTGVNTKSGNFDQGSLGNLSVGMIDTSTPNLDKNRKSTFFHSVLMRARKSMPFLLRVNPSPPASPVPAMPPNPLRPAKGKSLDPNAAAGLDPRRFSGTAPSTPLSPMFPTSAPYSAFPGHQVPAPSPMPPGSPMGHPAMHMIHPVPAPKHIITPAASAEPHLMGSARVTPELTAAAAAAAALAPTSLQPSPILTPMASSPGMVQAPMGPPPMSAASPYVPAPHLTPSPLSNTHNGGIPAKPTAARKGVTAFLEDKRSLSITLAELQPRLDRVYQQFRIMRRELSSFLVFCIVTDGKYRGQSFEMEITSPTDHTLTVCLRHSKGNWITFKKMASRLFKEMGM